MTPMETINFRLDALQRFAGVQIVASLHMVHDVEDWSRVRSPGRAARRRRQGHRQNIVIRSEPRRDAIEIDGGKTLVMHPVVLAEMKEQVRRGITERADKILHDVMTGGTV